MMLPLLRRSWAVRGQPPVLTYKSGHREKVSIAAALVWTPRSGHVELSYRTLKYGYFNNQRVATFLRQLLQRFGSLIVVWDGGNMHKGDPIRALLEQYKGRLAIEPLPPQGAELMPVEQLWSWLKNGQLCNFAPENAVELETVARTKLDAVRNDHDQLRRFFHASALRLPREKAHYLPDMR